MGTSKGDLHERLSRAAGEIARLTGREEHDVVVVLGSGLGGYPETLHDAVVVPYRAIPGFPAPEAPGHSGTAYSVVRGDNRVVTPLREGPCLRGIPGGYDHVLRPGCGDGRVPDRSSHQCFGRMRRGDRAR